MDHEMLKAVADLFDEKLAPIHEKLDEHSVILNEHSAILNEHSAILNEHSIILKEHGEKLDEHSAILKDHSEQLGTHSIMLKEQYGILKALEHSAEVNAAERDRTQHDIAYIKGSVQGLHRDMARVEEISAYNMAEIARLKAAQ